MFRFQLASFKLLTLLVLTVSSAQVRSQDARPQFDGGAIVREREQLRARVQFIHKAVDVSSKDYERAEILYGDTRAAFSGVIESIREAMVKDNLKSMKKDPQFKEKCQDAAATEAKFMAFFDSLVNSHDEQWGRRFGRSVNVDLKNKAATASEIAHSIDSFVDLFQKFRKLLGKGPDDEKKWFELRTEKAKTFVDSVQWPTWNEIVSSLPR